MGSLSDRHSFAIKIKHVMSAQLLPLGKHPTEATHLEEPGVFTG